MNEIISPVILVLTIIMPGQQPDVHKKLSMPNIEECFAQAKDWDERGLTAEMKAKGGIAVAAGCLVKEQPRT